MEDKILLAYATRTGSAARVAEVIAEALREGGVGVDVRPAKEVNDLSPYRAAVIGGAAYMGQWMKDVVKLVQRHRESLSRMPVAYFVVCLTMKEDTEENRATVAAYLDAVREQVPEVKPVSVGLFAGALERSKLPFLYRTIIKKMGAPEGDFLDREAIRTWASELLPLLKAN